MRKAGSKAAPWSVKGVDDATRTVAREAAQAAGLTLGAWIDRAILRHAGIAPPPANDIQDANVDSGLDSGVDAEALETEVAAAEGRIEGHLRPVGLAVARVAQRMVLLERGLKSLPPDWPSTLTVPETVPDSPPPFGEDHVAGGLAVETAEDQIVFPAPAISQSAESPSESQAEEDWNARWDRFKTELAEENADDAPTGAGTGADTGAGASAGDDEKTAASPASASQDLSESPSEGLPQRPGRRHFPGKLIVGGLVLVIGVGSGIALMSQSERLGMAPALQRTANSVIALGEDLTDALRRGTRWIEDRAWQLRGGRDSPEGAAVSEPPAEESAPSGQVAKESGAQQATGTPPSSPGAAEPAARPVASSAGTAQPSAALPAPPVAAPEPTSAGSAQARPGPEVAALPKTGEADTKPDAKSGPPTSSFAGIMEQRARQGDPEAQHDLAVLYATGEGRPQDMREAAYWFREAAIQGIPAAQYNLGVLYEKGTGVQQDDVRALLWYHSAAERNHPRAQYNLGLFYAQGRGIPVNYAEARKWLRRAGDQGMTQALFELGQMEERGLGDAPDISKARALYAQAAALGDRAAAERLVAMPLDSGVQPADAAGSADRPDSAAAAPLSPEAERETVRAVQQILIRLGHDIGAADGLLGERTREGIRDYQRRHDLPINGTPSPLLLQHMLKTMGKDPSASASTGATPGRAVSR